MQPRVPGGVGFIKALLIRYFSLAFNLGESDTDITHANGDFGGYLGLLFLRHIPGIVSWRFLLSARKMIVGLRPLALLHRSHADTQLVAM